MFVCTERQGLTHLFIFFQLKEWTNPNKVLSLSCGCQNLWKIRLQILQTTTQSEKKREKKKKKKQPRACKFFPLPPSLHPNRSGGGSPPPQEEKKKSTNRDYPRRANEPLSSCALIGSPSAHNQNCARYTRAEITQNSSRLEGTKLLMRHAEFQRCGSLLLSRPSDGVLRCQQPSD